jgi:hypothetical protein
VREGHPGYATAKGLLPPYDVAWTLRQWSVCYRGMLTVCAGVIRMLARVVAAAFLDGSVPGPSWRRLLFLCKLGALFRGPRELRGRESTWTIR